MSGTPWALMAVFGTILAFAALGLVSSLIYQWRAWRRRRTIERSR